MKSWTRLDWLILLIFAGLVVLFYWRILTPNPADRQSFPPGDFYLQFWAFSTFEVRELSAGRLPLWNPYAFAGSPFWADVQAAVFYPFSLLTLLLSSPWGFSPFALALEALAHFWLAAVFMYLFVRRITQSRAAAVISALTFTFSGYLTGYPSQQLAVLEADVWLPLMLYFLYQANQKLGESAKGESGGTIFFNLQPSALSPLLLAGVAWGLTLLAGHPQSAFIVACVSLAYFLYLRFTHRALRRAPCALRFTSHTALFLLTGLGLAAIQFIPAIEYTLLSVRAEGTYDKMSGGFPLIDVIQFLLPGQVSHYSPLYMGVIGLILASMAVFTTPARNRHTIFWALVAAVALFISFGGNTFLYTPLYLAVPGFSIFRGQERWAFVVAFGLSVLAGYGFKALQCQVVGSKVAETDLTLPASRLTPHVPRTTYHALRLTRYLFLFSLLLLFLFFVGLNQTGWTSQSPFYGLLGAATVLTILLALAWLLWKFAPQMSPVLFTSFTAALICFDLFTVNWQTNLYPQPFEWHTRIPAVVTAIKKDAASSPDEPFRVYNEFRLYDNYGMPYEIEDLWGASPLRPVRYDQFLAPPMPIERTWELLNVKYVITWRKELYVPSTIIYEESAEKYTTYVHRLNTVGPRAWLVTQTETANDSTILQKIADPNFDRWNIALLEEIGRFAWRLEIGDGINDATHTTFSVQRLTFNASSLTYRVTTSTPALLVLSEIDYPGWQAVIDGQPASILRADYVLRAIPVPAGEHTVELNFWPLSITVGMVISGLSLLGVLVLLIFARRVTH